MKQINLDINEAFLQANEIYSDLDVWSDEQIVNNRELLQLHARAILKLLFPHIVEDEIQRDAKNPNEIIK